MTNGDDILQLWRTHERKLEGQFTINFALLRKMNLDKVARKVNSLVLVKVVTLVFATVTAIALMKYTANNWQSTYIAIAGGVLSVWTVGVCAALVHELYHLLTIDYGQSLAALQRQLLNIRTTMIGYLRLGVWLAPLHLACVVLFFDLWFGIDIIMYGDKMWLVTQVLISVVIMLPLALYAHRKLIPENADKKWMQKLLQGNGTQIRDSLNLIREVEEMR
ncbi:hypothetical protein AB9P05_04485 [Roseivirga sp. BDSF3-8]|uniref:hypothetical protein n=1 Tax=Roseivirga sp. BDSF3-8 TaxID=3241598 RepID=UPI003531C71F